MNISISTGFNGPSGCPEESLKAIAEAGFTHLHWGHQWNSDFFYSKSEVQQIKIWLNEFGLKMLDIHGSRGLEKCWFSPVEYQRKAGVELVLNRARMLRELDGEGVLMMHVPHGRLSSVFGSGFGYGGEAVEGTYEEEVEALFRSMDELAPELEKLSVLIAVENMRIDTFDTIRTLVKRYPANLLGITYDSGHGNINPAQGLDLMEPLKDRLQALHLNDNDGTGDQHTPPFYGTLDWDKVITLVASSSYTRCASFELGMRYSPFFDDTLNGPQSPEMVKKYLADTYTRCEKVASLLEEKRGAK